MICGECVLSCFCCPQHINESESVVAEAVADGQVEAVVSAHEAYSRRVLRLQGGQTAILASGRVSHLHSGIVEWVQCGCLTTGLPSVNTRR